MNRILSRLLALLLIPSIHGLGQSVTLPDLPTTAPIIPAGTTLCTVPKSGGPCKTTQTIQLPPVTIKGQKWRVSLSGVNGTLNCTFGPAAKITKNPDGTAKITGVTCTLLPAVAP